MSFLDVSLPAVVGRPIAIDLYSVPGTAHLISLDSGQQSADKFELLDACFNPIATLQASGAQVLVQGRSWIYIRRVSGYTPGYAFIRSAQPDGLLATASQKFFSASFPDQVVPAIALSNDPFQPAVTQVTGPNRLDVFAELRKENNQLRDTLEVQRAENRVLSRLLEAARRPAEVQAPAPEAFELPDPYTRRVEMDDD